MPWPSMQRETADCGRAYHCSDVTIQAQIISLMKDLKRKLGMSIILITHDLGVVAGLAQRVVVMYAGKIIEQGMVGEIYYHAQHPYTGSA